MHAALKPHHFLGIDEDGRTCVVRTRGNAYGHIILRGGAGRPNYHPENVADASDQLRSSGLNPVLMVDCSHANSGKKHENQPAVWESLIDQRIEAKKRGEACPIIGAMIESNLKPGNQKLGKSKADLEYGVSVTDACLGWAETGELLVRAAERLG